MIASVHGLYNYFSAIKPRLVGHVGECIYPGRVTKQYIGHVASVVKG